MEEGGMTKGKRKEGGEGDEEGGPAMQRRNGERFLSMYDGEVHARECPPPFAATPLPSTPGKSISEKDEDRRVKPDSQ
jgi:hypothetical protein